MITLTELKSDFIFTILDLQLYVIFYPQEIKVFDLHTKELLLQKEITDDYDAIEADPEKKYSYYLKKDENIVYNILFSPLKEYQKLTTEAGYILHVGSTNSRGFYAGLYEFGSFTFEKEVIKQEKWIAHNNISYGLLHEENNLFYICRGSKGIECWNWSQEKPSLNWANKNLTVSKGLAFLPNDSLIIGTNDGTIFNFDQTGNILTQLKFEQEPIRHIIIKFH